MSDPQSLPKPGTVPSGPTKSSPADGTADPAAKTAAKLPAEPITDKSKLPKVKEIGGPEGPEPTRYGDWEVKGRVSDF